MLFCGQNRGALVLSCHLLKLPSTFWVKTVRQQQILGWPFRLGADEQPFLSLGLVISFIQLRDKYLGICHCFFEKCVHVFLGYQTGHMGAGFRLSLDLGNCVLLRQLIIMMFLAANVWFQISVATDLATQILWGWSNGWCYYPWPLHSFLQPLSFCRVPLGTQTSPVVSVHVLDLSLKIKYNSIFLFHRTGAVQIVPQQRPGSTAAILCHPSFMMEKLFCKAFLRSFHSLRQNHLQ